MIFPFRSFVIISYDFGKSLRLFAYSLTVSQCFNDEARKKTIGHISSRSKWSHHFTMNLQLNTIWYQRHLRSQPLNIVYALYSRFCFLILFFRPRKDLSKWHLSGNKLVFFVVAESSLFTTGHIPFVHSHRHIYSENYVFRSHSTFLVRFSSQ